MQSDDNIKYKKRDEGQLGDFGDKSPANSFSGGETDHLFLSLRGEQFYDLDLLSGLAHPGDGRTACLLDYDRDGWTDLVVASANAPTVQLYRNRIGEGRDGTAPVIALRFVGGNDTAAPAPRWSARNGYGARVEVELPDATLVREHRCGDGRAAQHSTTMLVGIGDAPRAEGLTVRWPTGRVQQSGPVAPGSLVTVYEDRGLSPTGEAFVVEPYLRRVLDGRRARPDTARPRLDLSLPASDGGPRLNVVVAMSTHCKSCKLAQPQVELLRETFTDAEVGLWGVGTDLEETGEELAAYAAGHRPHYRVLADLPLAERRALKQHVLDTYRDDLTPVTVVTDTSGQILATLPGVPDVSFLRKLLNP